MVRTIADLPGEDSTPCFEARELLLPLGHLTVDVMQHVRPDPWEAANDMDALHRQIVASPLQASMTVIVRQRTFKHACERVCWSLTAPSGILHPLCANAEKQESY